MAWVYTVVPFGFAALFLVGCELLLRTVMTLVNPRGDYAIPGAGVIREGE